MENKTYVPTESEDYMSDKMNAYFKEVLTNQALELHDLIKQHTQVATQKNEFVDAIDQASVETERNMGAVNKERDTRKLKSVKDAISRFKDDDFGYCIDCGIEIGVKRLLINPALPRCVDCAEIKEKTAHQYAR